MKYKIFYMKSVISFVYVFKIPKFLYYSNIVIGSDYNDTVTRVKMNADNTFNSLLFVYFQRGKTVPEGLTTVEDIRSYRQLASHTVSIFNDFYGRKFVVLNSCILSLMLT